MAAAVTTPMPSFTYSNYKIGMTDLRDRLNNYQDWTQALKEVTAKDTAWNKRLEEWTKANTPAKDVGEEVKKEGKQYLALQRVKNSIGDTINRCNHAIKAYTKPPLSDELSSHLEGLGWPVLLIKRSEDYLQQDLKLLQQAVIKIKTIYNEMETALTTASYSLNALARYEQKDQESALSKLKSVGGSHHHLDRLLRAAEIEEGSSSPTIVEAEEPETIPAAGTEIMIDYYTPVLNGELQI